MRDTNISVSNIGRIFTPVRWAEWCLSVNGVYAAWRNGATILDPTCGNGSFFKALMNIAKRRSDDVCAADLNRLHGIEIVASDKSSFLANFKTAYHLNFPEDNIIAEDFLFHRNSMKFDYAIGNPPWINFTDLSKEYKEVIKPVFVDFGLVDNKQDVLLGGSRIDIASLVIAKCMRSHVVENGMGIFFVPLSLFFNGSANGKFRPRSENSNEFIVKKLFDFDGNPVFQDISTRNGMVVLQKSSHQVFPVACIHVEKDMTMKRLLTGPVNGTNLWIKSSNQDDFAGEFSEVKILPHQKPRQGVNSCGLNKVFILERDYRKGEHLDDVAVLFNGYGDEIQIETNYVFPLLNAASFGGQKPKMQKFILCPYSEDGKELTWDEIENFPYMAAYLRRFQKNMSNRKGVLIRSKMKNGQFWSMLGVGSYCFSKWKVAWEAMGKRDFRAIIIPGRWQGNQALHAFIPCDSKEAAMSIKDGLNGIIPKYLKATGMEGTCNWAQPGRIKPFLDVESGTLFDAVSMREIV